MDVDEKSLLRKKRFRSVSFLSNVSGVAFKDLAENTSNHILFLKCFLITGFVFSVFFLFFSQASFLVWLELGEVSRGSKKENKGARLLLQHVWSAYQVYFCGLKHQKLLFLKRPLEAGSKTSWRK